jgi:hypothetical protein
VISLNNRLILNSFTFKAIRKILWGNPLMRSLTKGLNDKTFLKINYWWNTLENLDLDNPKTYTQKLQWLKVHWRDDRTTQGADKYLVRDYVIEVLGEEQGNKILNPLYGVYDDPDKINLSVLPQSFVLKANHGSGWNILVKDKNSLDWEKCKKMMRKWLKINYYYYGREYQYKNMVPKIICEKFLENSDGSEVYDYKFMCFNGEPTMLWVDYDRNTNHVRNYFDIDGNPYDYVSDVPANYNIPFVKPKNYEEMVEIARKLAKDFPHVRIDLYNLDGEIIFGEMTFTSWGGTVNFGTPKLNQVWGDSLELVKISREVM